MIVYHGTAAHHRPRIEDRGLLPGAHVSGREAVAVERYAPFAVARAPFPDDGLVVALDVPAPWLERDPNSADDDAAYRLLRGVPPSRLAFSFCAVNPDTVEYCRQRYITPQSFLTGVARV